MLWNRKANVLNNYIASKVIHDKVVIEELPNNTYQFYFNRKLKDLDCGVYIFIYNTELNQVVIGICHYEIDGNVSPLYEALNHINMESSIAHFFAKNGDIYASFPYLSTESEFNPIVLLDAIETVFRFMDNTVYERINVALRECIELNRKEKQNQSYEKSSNKHSENSGFITEEYDEGLPDYWDSEYDHNHMIRVNDEWMIICNHNDCIFCKVVDGKFCGGNIDQCIYRVERAKATLPVCEKDLEDFKRNMPDIDSMDDFEASIFLPELSKRKREIARLKYIIENEW